MSSSVALKTEKSAVEKILFDKVMYEATQEEMDKFKQLGDHDVHSSQQWIDKCETQLEN